jgi:hypothetical protein
MTCYIISLDLPFNSLPFFGCTIGKTSVVASILSGSVKAGSKNTFSC